MRLSHYIIFSIVFFTLLSCNVTRKLPQDRYLLKANIVKIDKDHSLSRTERVKTDQLTTFLKQRPNKRILGLDVYLWLYNKANPDKDNRINRWYRKVGEAPVLYDSAQTLKSVDGMSIYLRGRGFFNSNIEHSTDTTNRRINATYRIRQGTPYRLGAISYDYQDKFLEPIIQQDSAKTLLHTGNIFDVDVMQAERQRIADYLKNQGYYTFNINNISYVADSIPGEKIINIRMLIKQRIEGYNLEDDPIMVNNAIFRIKDIYILSDYNPNAAMGDSTYYKDMDTTEYRGVYFVHKNGVNIKPDVLLRAINIHPNSLYDAKAVNKTYDNLMRLNYFKNTNILFTEVKDSSSTNIVTFIGDKDEKALENYTREGYLSCNILCIPGDKQSYNIDVEATTTSNYYGLLLTTGYQNKNIFKGAEMLDFSITGGYEFMRIKDKRNSVEIGGALALTFPRFITPIKIDRYNKLNNVRTKIELSINSQNRPYYKRILSSGAIGYTWMNNKFSSYVLKPIDISIVKLNSVDESFLNSIQNPYLRNSYTSQLIAGISGSYLYNNQMSGVNKNTFRVRVNAETNGNLISLLTGVFSEPSSDGYHKLFGIQFSQYARINVDASYRIVLGHKTSLVYRLYVGSAQPYGNSTSVPFERLFYSGGPNSMRGWVARTLGPGNVPIPKNSIYPTQLGNFKLETNLEFRFPVYGFLHGALFADVGNIWLMGQGIYTPEAEFRMDSFYRQLGFDGGLGARFDFGFFLFRIDWGVKLHDPNRIKGDRWIKTFTLDQSAFNFGIGYPF